MTSEIKCPVCQNNLHKINIVVSTCTNDKCKLWGSSIPNLVLEALAQAKQDLEILTDSESRRQITYMTDGRTKVYYGQNGTQIETNQPLPVGFVITIKEATDDR